MLYYKCSECDYEYDPEGNGHEDFDSLPEDWKCVVCGAGKDAFIAVEPHSDESDIEAEA